MPKNPPLPKDRQRRLMGGLVDIFDYFEGKAWATALGIIIIIALIIFSIVPILP